MSKSNANICGKEIARLRFEKMMTRREVCMAISISERRLQSIESSDTSGVHITTLRKFCEFFNVDRSQLTVDQLLKV